jgi:two-component system chemotaxis response regulator CheB
MSIAASIKHRVDAIVVGTSAGGIEALSRLLPALPASLQATMFIVVHLPREGPSLLVDIFQPKCALRVREARDKEPVMAGAVYFAPPDYHLLIDRDAAGSGMQLALSVDDLVNYSRPSIDVLFESAADVYASRLMGIVLTGANEDGAAGLEAVHNAGGVTVVQDPADAQSWLMPTSAIERCAPDHVLPLQEICELLRGLAHGGAS